MVTSAGQRCSGQGVIYPDDLRVGLPELAGLRVGHHGLRVDHHANPATGVRGRECSRVGCTPTPTFEIILYITDFTFFLQVHKCICSPEGPELVKSRRVHTYTKVSSTSFPCVSENKPRLKLLVYAALSY